MTTTSCDYLVVGAGASGCVVASRLAEQAGCEVILLEAGRSDRSPFLRLPGLGFAAGAISDLNWNFLTEPIPALGDRRMTFLAGKVLGGSSSINGMIYTRGHSSEYDRWADMGCTGWTFDELRPYFLRSEANDRGAGPWHGGEGPMRLRRANPGLPICDAFLEAAAAAGLPIVDDLNANHREGLGWYDVNIDRGLRMSAARAFVHPARNRRTLNVVMGAEVTEIVFSSDRATGVKAIAGGALREFHARREVILSAGAIKTPQLLMISGIGPARALEGQGIRVRFDSSGVGQNLQNHPCYRPHYLCTGNITARKHVSPLQASRAAISYAWSRSGPLAESFASAGGFFKSDPALDLADMQVVFLSAMPPRGAKRLRDLLPKEHGFGMTIYQGTPYSRGQVRLRSPKATDPPVIEAGYFSDSRDLKVLAAGVERMRDVIRQPEIARHIRSAVTPHDRIRSQEALIEDIRREAATSYHSCGTCAMGSDSDAVVDPELRVRGVRGLRVADASIIPRLPNAALHAVTLMIGEKAASMIGSQAA
jgi:choline dehydrogenase